MHRLNNHQRPAILVIHVKCALRFAEIPSCFLNRVETLGILVFLPMVCAFPIAPVVYCWLRRKLFCDMYSWMSFLILIHDSFSTIWRMCNAFFSLSSKSLENDDDSFWRLARCGNIETSFWEITNRSNRPSPQHPARNFASCCSMDHARLVANPNNLNPGSWHYFSQP